MSNFKSHLLYELSNWKEKFQKGIIIETGAGSPLYTLLCTRPNTASKIVKYSLSPTEWEYTKEKYNIRNDNTRAVSSDTVLQILSIEKERNFDKGVKWYFTNSIQIGNDAKTTTHGWIGYSIENRTILYHFTIDKFHHHLNREETIDIIEQICLDVLLSENKYSVLSGYIDSVIVVGGSLYDNKELVLKNLITRELSNHTYNDTYVYCKDGNNFDRINSLFRDLKSSNKELVIFKGSFNPLHVMHYEIYRHITEILGKYCVLMISINNRDKTKIIDIDNLLKRIKVLDEMKIPYIINNNGYYDDCSCYFESHYEFDQNLLSYVLGEDIMNRFIEDEKKSKHKKYDIPIKYYVIERDNINKNRIINENYNIEYLDMLKNNISSTYIRNNLNDPKLCDLYKDNEKLLKIIKDVFTGDTNT